ncbi:MAG: DUF1080 domain-containing protein [Akkermansiaceae bacterium]|nr:DUF1080 domain-containing protein [Akkermansiaceae bacterium]
MKTLLRIAPIAALVCGSACLAQEGAVMRSLFNGKDLTGWKGKGYVVEDGAIVCNSKGKNLITEETFANYVLDFEFKLTAGANNGLGINYPGTGVSAYTGLEIQILDSTAPKYKDLKDYQFHAGIYTLQAAKQGFLKPVGEWNRERVTVNGPSVTVEVNGAVVLTADLDKLSEKNPKHAGVKRRSGHIGWMGHGDKVSFRNINIGEIAPAANEAGVKAAGFTKIFDGKTLSGWKHGEDITNWTASNGIIKHNGKPGSTKDLWSEKPYKDFTLVCDWRWSGRGPMMDRPLILADGSQKGSAKVEELDSGIYLRGNSKSQVNLWNWPVGSGEVYGYRMDKKMSPEVKAGVTPKMNADKPLGEWNRTMITLKGDRLTVNLNGKTVIKDAQLPGIPAEGPIGFQQHGAAIDFANVWIKEL